MSKLQTIEEILEDLAIEASGYCCMNEDCDGYHPREDEDREKAKKKAKAAIEAMLRDIIQKPKLTFSIQPGKEDVLTDDSSLKLKMYEDQRQRATKYNLDI